MNWIQESGFIKTYSEHIKPVNMVDEERRVVPSKYDTKGIPTTI